MILNQEMIDFMNELIKQGLDDQEIYDITHDKFNPDNYVMLDERIIEFINIGGY